MRKSPVPTHALCTYSLAALVLLLAATGTSAALQIVWGPILGDLAPTSAQLTWYTNLPSFGHVEVGGQVVARGGPTQAHKVLLKGLEPGTHYYYRLVAQAHGEQTTSRRYRFTTPAADLEDFTFCAYGDTRSDAAAHKRVVWAMMAWAPAFILHTGDLVTSGASMADWHQFFPVIARFSPTVPLYPCLGNHEGNAVHYYDLLPLPAGGGERGGEWYATVHGNCQVVALDSCRRQEEQAAWLRDLLGKPRPPGVSWRLVMFHHPPYTSGPHPPDAQALKYFCPYLETPGAVDLVFNGHNHYYERSRRGRLNYITAGGGGALLYRTPTLENPYRQAFAGVYSYVRVRVSAERLELTALDTDGQPLDHCTVTR